MGMVEDVFCKIEDVSLVLSGRLSSRKFKWLETHVDQLRDLYETLKKDHDNATKTIERLQQESEQFQATIANLQSRPCR